jgi:outer membrane lipoprotein-sorting protein
MRLHTEAFLSRRAAIFASACLSLAMLCLPAGAAELSLELLMQTLGTVKAGEARFTERREVPEMNQIFESSGRLSFSAPDVFVRETLKPSPQMLAVKGNMVTMSQGGRSRTMMLDATPEAQVIVEAIRGTLTGNRELLERHFTARTSGSLDRWTLELVPREARLRGQVANVKVRGRQADVSEMEVLQADGDRSLMRIEPLAATAR